MPMISIAVSAAPSPDLARAVALRATELTAAHLGKDPAVTAVAVSFVPRDQWFIAGRSLEERALSSFWLDIKITDATNTKGEMSAYIRAIFGAMTAVLGPLHEESYVLVHAVPAAAYGYGGKTQEFRFVAGALARDNGRTP